MLYLFRTVSTPIRHRWEVLQILRNVGGRRRKRLLGEIQFPKWQRQVLRLSYFFKRLSESCETLEEWTWRCIEKIWEVWEDCECRRCRRTFGCDRMLLNHPLIKQNLNRRHVNQSSLRYLPKTNPFGCLRIDEEVDEESNLYWQSITFMSWRIQSRKVQLNSPRFSPSPTPSPPESSHHLNRSQTSDFKNRAFSSQFYRFRSRLPNRLVSWVSEPVSICKGCVAWDEIQKLGKKFIRTQSNTGSFKKRWCWSLRGLTCASLS